MHLLRLPKSCQTAFHIVLLLANAAEVEVSLDVVVMFDGGEQLFFALLEEAELVVALPQRQFPPGVLIVVRLCGVTGQLQTFANVVLHVEEVLEH
jgi:hypothetical protein